MIGPKIKTLKRLFTLVDQKRSVVHAGWPNPCPAAIVVHMPAIVVHHMIRRGWLFEHQRKP